MITDSTMQHTSFPEVTGEVIKDSLRDIKLADLPDPTPVHTARVLGNNAMQERLFRIALADVESNIIDSPDGKYLGAGASFSDWIYTRDISYAGVLGLNHFYPQLTWQSLQVNRRRREALGFKISRGYKLEQIDVKWDSLDMDEAEFIRTFKINNYVRGTDDVGSYVIALGRDCPIVDPGGEVYTKRTFSGRRYESKILNSFGHSVPVVAGHLQDTGESARGELIEVSTSPEMDYYQIDMTLAYQQSVPELESLMRNMEYYRSPEGTYVEMTDEVFFSSPQSYANAWITLGNCLMLDDSSFIMYDGKSAVRVTVDAEGEPFRLSEETLDEEQLGSGRIVRRVSLELLNPVESAWVHYTIEKAEVPSPEMISRMTSKKSDTSSPVSAISAHSGPIVVIKADDICYHKKEGKYGLRWQRFFDLTEQMNIPISVGLICKSISTKFPDYIDAMRKLAKSDRIELWNHGLTHGQNTEKHIAEFHGTTLEQQVETLKRSQAAVKELLGVEMHTFGSPFNTLDENTIPAIQQNPDIKVWLYGKDPEHKLQDVVILKHTIDLEHPVHYPNFDHFTRAFEAHPNEPYYVLQMHPNSWDDRRFEEFTRVINWLKERNARFVTPSELAGALKQEQ